MRHDPTDHAASSKLSHPDHAINTLGEEVNPLVTDTEDDLDIRVALGKLWQPRDDEWLG